MSERKVLQKYYPPDFNPADLGRRPKKSGGEPGVRVQTVRLMAPFSMRCAVCGEYIYKGRKFNARKQTPPGEKYLSIQIFYFSIKCTRCSGEIVFKTDPQNNDYAMVKGAQRNMEPWRNREQAEETTEERLDRLEREQAEADAAEGDGVVERNAMADLEAQDEQSRREMAVADALDERRQKNARIERAEKEGVSFLDSIVRTGDEERARAEQELDEQARREFAQKRNLLMVDTIEEEEEEEEVEMPPPPAPKATAPILKKKKAKKDYAALAGIKRV